MNMEHGPLNGSRAPVSKLPYGLLSLLYVDSLEAAAQSKR